ncbi:MAG: hypothetical protein V2I43_05900, partial [Parvularcula sp.]|nr:hypothetical protein [Parvularcula sp.]
MESEREKIAAAKTLEANVSDVDGASKAHAGRSRAARNRDHRFAERRAEKRALSRNRANARVQQPLSDTQRKADVLALPVGSGSKRARIGFLVLLGALALHGVVIVAAVVTGSWNRTTREPPKQTIAIQVKAPEPPPPPPEPEPIVEPEPQVEQAPPPPEPKPRPRPRPKPEVAAPPPPQDTPPPEPQAKPPPRIVGLSLDSTSAGGDGPSFAVGNTREGQTRDRAADPKDVPEVGVVDAPPTQNRVSNRIPTVGIKYEP